MKALFVTTRLFWPTDSGRKVSLFHYCKGLHDRCGCDVHLFSFTESGQTAEQLSHKPDFIDSAVLAEPVKKFTKVKNLFTKSVFGGWPFQCSLYYSRKNNKKLKRFCEELKPDVIIVDMIRLAPYYSAFKKLKAVKILDLDDLLSERYKRQALSGNNKADIFGNYADNVSELGKSILKKGFLKRRVLKSESKRVRKAEIKYGRIYDKTIFVSEKETKKFNEICAFDKAYTVRLGVDCDYYAQPTENVNKIDNSIAFMGNLKVAANIDSFCFIIDKILPRLNFAYKFHVIGAVSEEVVKAYGNENIIFHGRVDDVRPLIKSCKVFLSPIVYGTGIKTKILEAMAMGLPVVTNTIGAEGIEAENGVHFYVSDSESETAEIVNGLMNSDVGEITRNAQLLIKEKYSWDGIYDDLYSVVVDGAGNENNMDNA